MIKGEQLYDHFNVFIKVVDQNSTINIKYEIKFLAN